MRGLILTAVAYISSLASALAAPPEDADAYLAPWFSSLSASDGKTVAFRGIATLTPATLPTGRRQQRRPLCDARLRLTDGSYMALISPGTPPGAFFCRLRC
jgi:hypothetical protein